MKKIYCHSKILFLIGCMLMFYTAIGNESVSVAKDTGSNEGQNKKTIRHLIDEVYHKGNTAILDEVIAENCISMTMKRRSRHWK